MKIRTNKVIDVPKLKAALIFAQSYELFGYFHWWLSPLQSIRFSSNRSAYSNIYCSGVSYMTQILIVTYTLREIRIMYIERFLDLRM